LDALLKSGFAPKDHDRAGLELRETPLEGVICRVHSAPDDRDAQAGR
jgi:hypothetical protein